MFKVECKDVDYILAVAKYKTISKAAEALFISQPALTKYIHNLEARLGVDLFERGTRPLILTAAGELYVSYASEIAATRNTMEFKLGQLQEDNLELIRIGFSITGLRAHICAITQQLLDSHANVRIHLRELNSNDIEQEIISGKLDIGFISLPTQSDSIETKIIYEEDILVAVPSDNPVLMLAPPSSDSHFPIIDLNLLQNEVFVLSDARTRFSMATNALFQQADFVPRVFTTASNNISCMEFAESFHACTFTTRSFIRNLRDPKSMSFYIAGSNPHKIYFGLVYRKGQRLTPYTYHIVNKLNESIVNEKQCYI